MRRLRVFVAHELATQIRSARFHGVTLAYLVASTAPAVAVFITRQRTGALVSAATYGSFVDAIQPLLTTLFAAAIAVDAVARERDENSLGVVSMAPISAAGYVLRRWLAIVFLMLPVTLMPRLAAIGLFAMAERSTTGIESILFGWLIHIVPVLIVVTALAMALGTITNRVVLALLAGLGIFTVGMGITNDLLAYAHHQIDGPGAFFGIGSASFLRWFMRGYIDVDSPSAAGYPLAEELDLLWIHSALAVGIAALFLGISCAYLRRTKRDIRPWKIRDDHPLRSFLRTLNRFREELSPDGGLEIPERIAIALGLIIPIAALVMINRRYEHFETLAAERFAAETRGVAPMPATIFPAAASLRGRISRSGELDATVTLTMRNDGDAPQRDLAFALNRGIVVERVTASRGTARADRVWERLGIALDPPLAPKEARSITVTMRGAPGRFEFELPYGNNFGEAWRRYLKGTHSYELADLSRSAIYRDATAQSMFLLGWNLVPVPRYTPWEVNEDLWGWRWARTSMPTFVTEKIRPPTDISIDLDVPQPFTVVDVCGTMARGHISSRCTFPIGDYLLMGARYETIPLTGGIRLAYLPPHASLARTHGPALAQAIEMAKQSWPTFRLHERAVFIERPRWPGERYRGDWSPVDAVRSVSTVGAINTVPEPMFIRLRPLGSPIIAASLIAGDLNRRRALAKDEQRFFLGFYETMATWRTGGQRPTAVEPPIGGKPLTDPIIDEGTGGWRGPIRLRRVLVDIDYRIGTDRLVAGVEDFLAAGPKPGTAKELLDAIGRSGGISLDRYYQDYFIGRALPRLTLADVKFTRVDGGWEARGSLKNEADGEVFCPVVLRTAGGAVRTTLRVDARSSTPFVLRAQQEPRTLQLDPEKVVYRHAAVGLIESVDFKGAS